MKSCQCQFNKFNRMSGQLWLQYHRCPQRGTTVPSARSMPCLCPSPSSLMTQSASTEPAWTAGMSSCGCSKVKKKRGPTAHCVSADNWFTHTQVLYLILILYKLPQSQGHSLVGLIFHIQQTRNDCWHRSHIFVTCQIKHLWLNHMK